MFSWGGKKGLKLGFHKNFYSHRGWRFVGQKHWRGSGSQDNTKWKREMEKALDKDSGNSGSGPSSASNQSVPLWACYNPSPGLGVLTSKMKEVDQATGPQGPCEHSTSGWLKTKRSLGTWEKPTEHTKGCQTHESPELSHSQVSGQEEQPRFLQAFGMPPGWASAGGRTGRQRGH